MPTIKLLHTSDWHLGRTLYGKKRYEEFEAFLAWLVETIHRNEIDVLLVAGDVFDTATPSNRAQGLYYRFLCKVAASSCRHVVVIAGNHDSPSFLDAPKELLKALAVHVVGSASSSPEDEVIVLRDEQGTPELIVCAVPYLRDRDIRVAEAGENIEDKERKLLEGIRTHYAMVADSANKKRSELGVDIPIVGMGHLFTAGGQTIEGDGVRELYVGSLAHVAARTLPTSFNYVALGHLHVPQKVAGSETIRYSGSPIPMGFGEANQQKSVCMVEFHNAAASTQLINVPVFQKLVRTKGDWSSISSRIDDLSATDDHGWLEVIYDGSEVIGDLRERLESKLAGTKWEILRIKNNRIIGSVLGQSHEAETLDDLDEDDVFERFLMIHKVPEDQHPELHHTYRETVLALGEDETQAQ